LTVFKSVTFRGTVGVCTAWLVAMVIGLHGCQQPAPPVESATLAARPPTDEKPAAAEPAQAAPPAAETPQTAAPAAKTVAGPETYEVKAGDSLYQIAKRVLGDANRWPEIFELNKDVLKGDPQRLQVGQVLKLPPKKKPKTE
jgi:nucleoid-associated protein YgaU